MGKLIVFTAPSGAGKTTVVRHLLANYKELGFSISATNRKKRKKEKGGFDYYFLSTQEFKKRVKNEEFVEWEEVYDNQFYGTLKSEVDRVWGEGKDIVFDIEVKGATNIKKLYPEAMVVFIRPPSLQVLIDRLNKRKTETEASLKKRIARVKEELTYENNFDRILVNDVLEVALKEAELMIESFIGISDSI
ncbi:MAG: guanylate kinase [Polaribacter sp.]|jgi:guanylate kinase